MDLYHYFMTQRGRDIIKNPHYFPIYERHLRRFVDHPVTVFEIGTGNGGSCQMWKCFFGPMARIVTIDISDNSGFEEPQIFPRRGAQADKDFMYSLLEEFGAPTVVLDDGSHLMDDINVSFSMLAPRMTSGGVYMVEDLDGAYWPERGGGVGAATSFIERCKLLVDEMNALYTRGVVSPTPEGTDIWSVSFYQMIVAIEKSPFLNREMIRMPTAL